MLKYTTTQVTFREIPDEITLCINISNCPIHCPDCHSKELWKDIGAELTVETLIKLCDDNDGVTTICFLGGDSDTEELGYLINALCQSHDNCFTKNIAWYSGRDNLKEVSGISYVNLDYIKLGHFDKNRGGLDKPTTNQRLYKLWSTSPDTELIAGLGDGDIMTIDVEDITYKFWNNVNIQKTGLDT
jgi:anaerobic ribonucleoside-triphosphate reductase activating protein